MSDASPRPAGTVRSCHAALAQLDQYMRISMSECPQFDGRYKVGIEQVDREHRQLFEIAARVHAGLGAGNAAALANAQPAIAELLDHVETHFASEEALMKAADYPYLETHRALHRHLLLQVRDMELRAAAGERYLPAELNYFIHKWLIDHIVTNDRMFGDFMAARWSNGAEFVAS
jgi:hemerythrin-like metal-binding protein